MVTVQDVEDYFMGTIIPPKGNYVLRVSERGFELWMDRVKKLTKQEQTDRLLGIKLEVVHDPYMGIDFSLSKQIL